MEMNLVFAVTQIFGILIAFILSICGLILIISICKDSFTKNSNKENNEGGK